MHLATEVTSTTNLQVATESTPVMHSNKSSSNHTNGSANSANNNNNNHTNSNNSNLLTAENLAERTLEGLLAEHPGELTRTGSPHIVSEANSLANYSRKKNSQNANKSKTISTKQFVKPTES